MFLRLLDGGIIPDENKAEWVRALAKCFRTLSRDRLCVFGQTVPTLRELKRLGKKLFLLSNAQMVFTEVELALSGLSGIFAGIMISSECGMRKPQTEFMRLLLDRFGLDPNKTVMIGNDISTDMVIDSNCAVDGVLLNTAHDSFKTIEERLAKYRLKGRRIKTILSGDISELLE